ncbi:lysine 2,3-aminomutase YodO family protein [Methanococcus vannielii SB]|uniref:Lysine 2,3-aminomutase YodO family protein n=1 Tax=Methanococcus vannielii (strain ATCC 35089 / DSM 1224 / JCM 13029 / OCM 148 / SB) TaxID=406327 RepID=A6URH1_METVS|nr:KamA family radical SAM protein [Methanococcus vannielii]ABR55093.1 lysine 2,3-aminomutase YodO family protein [Methanococcus vannielii SB]
MQNDHFQLKMEQLLKTDTKFYSILVKSNDLNDLRHEVYKYLNSIEKTLYFENTEFPKLEIINMKECIKVFKNIISPKNEKLAEFSAINALWNIYKGETTGISLGFLNEMIYLLRGINGKSGIYSKDFPEFLKLNGRKAAINRSFELDKLSNRAEHFIGRYPSGISKKVSKTREDNKKRILDYFNVGINEWNDWKWHIKNIVTDSKTLENLVRVSELEKYSIEKARENNIPFGITPYYVSLMDNSLDRRNDHAVRAQVIPPVRYVEKTIEARSSGKNLDFMGESDTSPVDLVTRRYPMIAIMKPYETCAQICVYCQRNWQIKDVFSDNVLASKESVNNAINWFNENECIKELLLTGGDPAILSNEYLDYLLSEFSKIKHLERIRIGTRTPVALPQRITNEFSEILGKYNKPGVREIAISTHVEHVYEVTADLRDAISRLKNSGITVYNQQVFTIENSRRFETSALRKVLKLIGIEPYYLFNTKGKEETTNYRVPIARALQERKEEARLLPGYCRTDSTVFNVPKLGKNNLNFYQDHDVIMIMNDGSRVYEFHPWEKNISLTKTYIYKDVPIYNYLCELKSRGEKVEDYSSIWYYF